MKCHYPGNHFACCIHHYEYCFPCRNVMGILWFSHHYNTTSGNVCRFLDNWNTFIAFQLLSNFMSESSPHPSLNHSPYINLVVRLNMESCAWRSWNINNQTTGTCISFITPFTPPPPPTNSISWVSVRVTKVLILKKVPRILKHINNHINVYIFVIVGWRDIG